ncbi:MAG: hypothetical protein HKO57_09205, partial [Akkermansiaceae bacterium]|nr:hypothetical protein [Akkermansiaceae bacterium]
MATRKATGWAGGIVATVVAAGLVSCASERSVTSTSRAAASGIDRYMLADGDIRYGEAGSSQEGQLVGGKRSQFEGRRQTAFGGEVTAAALQKKNYAAAGWTGSKEATTKSYAGRTDGDRFRWSSLFGKRKAREAAGESTHGSKGFATSGYRTATAAESGGDP